MKARLKTVAMHIIVNGVLFSVFGFVMWDHIVFMVINHPEAAVVGALWLSLIPIAGVLLWQVESLQMQLVLSAMDTFEQIRDAKPHKE